MRYMYWKDVDYLLTEKIPIPGGGFREETRHITKELSSEHPQVDKLFFSGYMPVNPEDGGKKTYMNLSKEQFDAGEVPEAIEYIKSL